MGVIFSTNNRDMEPKEDDDEVTYEIDVFINQTLADDLYVLQYPLRAPWNPYPSQASAKFKQRSQFLRLDCKAPKSDEQKKMDRALTQQAELPSEQTEFTLESTIQPMGATYAIGILNEGQLHLNPLRPRFDRSAKTEKIEKSEASIEVESVETEEPETVSDQPEDFAGGGILQMRPSFTHLIPTLVGEEAKSNGSAGNDSEEPQKVKVRYQSKKQQKLKEWQKSTYSYKMKEFEEEPFVRLNYYHPDSSFKPLEKLSDLFYDGEDSEVPNTVTRREYLDTIVGEAAQPIPKTIPYGVCSRSKRETLPLLPQLVQLMKSVVLMQFGRIRQLISINCEDIELIAALETVAVVINGIWIVKRFIN